MNPSPGPPPSLLLSWKISYNSSYTKDASSQPEPIFLYIKGMTWATREVESPKNEIGKDCPFAESHIWSDFFFVCWNYWVFAPEARCELWTGEIWLPTGSSGGHFESARFLGRTSCIFVSCSVVLVMFCMLLFNFVCYVFLLMCLCILIFMYVPF